MVQLDARYLAWLSDRIRLVCHIIHRALCDGRLFSRLLLDGNIVIHGALVSRSCTRCVLFVRVTLQQGLTWQASAVGGANEAWAVGFAS